MRRYRELFFGSIDLQDEPDVNSYIYTIDPVDHLGPANAEQRAERKESESFGREMVNAFYVTVILTLAAAALMAAGIYIGATKPEVWNYLPGVSSPPGEHAEPEESAR